MQKARTKKSYSKAEDAVIRKRKEELRHAQDIREHYLRKLERTEDLYLQLNEFLDTLKHREKDLLKYVPVKLSIFVLIFKYTDYFLLHY
jgi:hypothetical protein